ncbi:class I SAM-dependent methyltransferase [Rufibacter roseus]|uniref:GMT-like wHTH domain-containing protein n=1 Tax=Rufibacter roseus TaxID=1567108 RepID=A0ABW2DL78_9BACT|nr:hypothetical protein [Rufibacter roseus]
MPKFLPLWGEVVMQAQKDTSEEPSCLFIDLNAGAAKTKEIQEVSSLKILKSIFVDAGFRMGLHKSLSTYFSDANKGALQALESQVLELNAYEALQHKPVFVSQKAERQQLKEHMSATVPSLLCAEPFSYKYSQEVSLHSLELEYVDCLLLLDPKKLKQAIKNQSAEDINSLFEAHFQKLKGILQQEGHASKKEEAIMAGLVQALGQRGFFTTKFRINAPGKDSTDYYLLYVSKNELLHARFKELLLGYSEYQEDGVPLMGANLKPLRLLVPEYHKFLKHSMVNLVEDLAKKASLYNSMRLEKIYEKHHVGTPYSKANYFEAFEKLKAMGKVRFMNPKTGQMVSKLAYGSRVKFLVE